MTSDREPGRDGPTPCREDVEGQLATARFLAEHGANWLERRHYAQQVRRLLTVLREMESEPDRATRRG